MVLKAVGSRGLLISILFGSKLVMALKKGMAMSKRPTNFWDFLSENFIWILLFGGSIWIGIIEIIKAIKS